MTVTYTLLRDGICIRYEAESTRDTFVSLTNHAYFNLAGHGNGSVLDHTLALAAEEYTPAGADNLPFGRLAPVAGTALDFCTENSLGARIGDALLAPLHGYDHNFALSGRGIRRAAKLSCPRSGVSMAVDTTMEGMQLYTANFIQGQKVQGGAVCKERDAFCLETQYFPNSINEPNFTTPLTEAGKSYDTKTVYAFSIA